MVGHLNSSIIWQGGGMSPPPPFTPASISGLQLWLDAADTATITHSGGSVSQWDDKSGNGYHATQATGASQFTTGVSYINGRNALLTNGFKFMVLPSGLYTIPTGNNTIIAVAERDSVDGSASQALIAGNSYYDNTRSYFIDSADHGTKISAQSNGSYGNTIDFAVAKDNLPHAYVMRRNGTTNGVKVWRDGGGGSTPAAGSNVPLDNLFIGRNDQGIWDQWKGKIGCILIWNRALTDVEINQLGNQFLNPVWGITWTNI